jgi:hypothetical protein
MTRHRLLSLGLLPMAACLVTVGGSGHGVAAAAARPAPAASAAAAGQARHGLRAGSSAARSGASRVTLVAARPTGTAHPGVAPVATTAAVTHRVLVPTRRRPAPLTPEQYGAIGDGVHDDTAALQRALDAASAWRPLELPAGTVFAHSAVLYVRVGGEVVEGSGTLLATAEATSSVWVEANRVTLEGITVATSTTTQRWSAWEQMGLRLDGHSGAVIRDVTVTGSAAAGIYVGGADHFLLDHDTVRDTRADGIHMTGGASDGTVIDPTTVATGDDGVAVVSYGSDATPCHDITVTGAHVEGTTGGRGMSVVGGSHITYTRFEVDDSDAAGVYVAAESAPYFTEAPVDVTISDGIIRGANTDPTIDHGAVLVVSEESPATPTRVLITHLVISDTRSTASRDAGVISYAAAPVDVVLSDFTITGGPSSAYEGNAPATSYSTSGWTLDGVGLPNHAA